MPDLYWDKLAENLEQLLQTLPNFPTLNDPNISDNDIIKAFENYSFPEDCQPDPQILQTFNGINQMGERQLGSAFSIWLEKYQNPRRLAADNRQE